MLKPFKIGPLEIKQPFFLAALAGYSDLPYRRRCRQYGAPYCVTEMMLDRLVLTRGRHQSVMLASDAGDHPVGGQIIGNDPEVMANSAAALGKLGFDVIDLNFACPVNKAMKRKRGGWLMSDPDQIIAITQAVVPATDRPVTLKLRRSFEEADTTHDAFWRVAEAAFDAGVAAICVHARSVEVKYTGPADWDFLAEAKRRFPDRVLLGSGDVLTPQRVLDMLNQTGVDGVAVARGVLGNPWFFRQVLDIAEGEPPYQPTSSEQREIIVQHFVDACELYGPRRGPKIMRKFGIKYARLHPHARKVRNAFAEVKTPGDWLSVLDEFYPPVK